MARSIISWIVTAVSFTAVSGAVSASDCQAAAPTQVTLNNITTASLNVIGNYPFGLVYASKDIAFVGLGTSLGVLNTSTFAPTLIRQISLQDVFTNAPLGFYSAYGLAISRDKRIVYAAIGLGAVAVDVGKAVAGDADSILGSLNGKAGTAAIEVTVSIDDKYVFVSQEYGNKETESHGAIEVFNVKRNSNGSLSSTDIGFIALGYSVVGTALSPDGSKLYATSEAATSNGTQGTLSILDVATLKTNPSNALLASVDAGCGPVRVVVSQNGKHIWVTARESNKLLAFDAAKLESNSANALLASVQVGTSPVGLILVNQGRHIITADSNRFSYTNTTTGLTVVDVHAALQGRQGFPRIPTGLFPREFALGPDRETLLVSEYGSEAIQAVDVSQLA
jgi:DNA-binding beta-propeller fold protein YncE